ncbi:MAG: hypothetical protein IQL11_00930 [Bacteroidales bacterium]|nr:hypothetical protein [Bacteroidales bacterium]
MSRIYLAIFMICMFTTCNKKDTSENEFLIPEQLLRNTDLEADSASGRYFYWWNSGLGTGYEAKWTDEESYSPSHSLKISCATVDSANFWYWGQYLDYNIPYGHDLTLTAKIKGVSLEGEGVWMVLRCDAIGEQVQYEITGTSIAGTFDWTTFTLDLSDVKGSVRVIYVFLGIASNTTGTVYFDDITLTQK